MMRDREPGGGDGSGLYTAPQRVDGSLERPPPPGQLAVVGAAALIGFLLMGMQLWLLTVALDLYLAGEGRRIWQLMLSSLVIFLGGLWVLRLLGRRPRVGT